MANGRSAFELYDYIGINDIMDLKKACRKPLHCQCLHHQVESHDWFGLHLSVTSLVHSLGSKVDPVFTFSYIAAIW